MSTYYTQINISAEDVYDLLSGKDKQRFNKAIITDVTRESDMSVSITVALVNDIPLEEMVMDSAVEEV